MDDDDEFGGFEAADPADEEQNAASGIQAGPSPWAFYPGAGGANQPDLIQPPGAAASAGVDVVRSRVQDPLEPNFNANPQDGVRSFSEQVLEPRFGSNRPTDQPVPDGVLDLDLTNRQATAPSNRQQPDDLDLELEPDLGDVGGAAAVADVAAGQAADRDLDQPQVAWPNAAGERNGQEHAEAARAEGMDALQQQVHDSQQEKSRLQQELEEMTRRSGQLEEDMGRLRQELTEQQGRYAELQEQHARDLEEMRQAGQQALALIVDEYKELCKTAVLEQQEACQAQVIQVIQQERDNYSQLLHKQAEDLEAKLESERSSLQDYVKQVIAEQTEKAQKEIDAKIEAGKLELGAQIKQSLQKAKEDSESLIKEEVKKEAENMKSAFEEEQTKLAQFYEEEKVKLKEEVTLAVEVERERCKECMKEAVREERERGQQLSRDVISQAQRHVTQYINDHKQRDAVVRKKSFASIELLLSSAQRQLQALMSSQSALDSNLGPGPGFANSAPELLENPGPAESAVNAPNGLAHSDNSDMNFANNSELNRNCESPVRNNIDNNIDTANCENSVSCAAVSKDKVVNSVKTEPS